MNEEVAISVRNVSKRYFVYESPRARLRKCLWPSSTSGVSELWALRDVSFEARKGDAIGIIGLNGSGKSTLLEIITGTQVATAGSVSTNGRIAALLQLGSGFNPEYTGRENVFLNGLLMGLTRADVENRFDEIAAFADIGDVLGRPVKTYSSGMLVRLAFAVQVALDPEILIVDEALSVGDYFFRQKCFGHIRKLRDRGLTLLFVTHDTNTVMNICTRALYVNEGQLLLDGKPDRAIQTYLRRRKKLSSVERAASSVERANVARDRIPEKVQWRRADEQLPALGGLLAVAVLDSGGELATKVQICEHVQVKVYFCPDPERSAHIYLSIRNAYDRKIFTTSTWFLDIPIHGLEVNRVSVLEFDIEMSLGGGEYSFAAMLARPEPPNGIGAIVDQVGAIGPIRVGGDYNVDRVPFQGPFGLPVAALLRQLQLEE